MGDHDLGRKIRADFETVASRRVGNEQLWLQDLRQYKGIYDPEIAGRLSAKRSKAFVRETRSKVRTVDARLMDLLFPANGEKNWGIDPTPNPELPPDQQQLMMQNLAKTIQVTTEGQRTEPTKEEVDLAIRSIAKDKAGKMSTEIEDQLADLKYRNMIKTVLHSGNLYGTGWLKGPLVEKRTRNKWVKSPGAVQVQTAQGIVNQQKLSWALSKTEVLRPYAESKPIWNIYPDMSVTDINDVRFVYERHMMPKHKLLALAEREDFFGNIIKGYIEDMPNGDAKFTTFENEMYNMRDFNQAPLPTVVGMYELIEYWGYVEGRDLIESNVEGITEDMLMADIPVNIFVLGDYLVKVAVEPIPGLVIPYHVYYFDKDETSIFGEGISAIMRDPQRLLNASVRAMIDNAGHCAGPQYEVNVDLLDEGEDPMDAGAFKVWLRTGKDADVAGKEVVRVKQIASYTQEFLLLTQTFSKMGEEITMIPRYLQGDARVSGAGRTASGLSMLMGQANIGLSDQVKTFDDGITKPFITGMYNWNMEFNDNDDIKGDLQIQARGSTALMAKEIRAQQIIQMLQLTGNGIDISWTKRGDLLRKLAESTDIGSEVIRTEQERKDWLAENQQGGEQGAQQQQQQQQLAQMAKQVMGALEELGGRVQQIEQVIGGLVQRMGIQRRPMIMQGAGVAEQ